MAVILAPMRENMNCNLCRKLAVSVEKQFVFYVDSVALVNFQRTFKPQ